MADDPSPKGDAVEPAKGKRPLSQRAQADLTRARKALGWDSRKTDDRVDFHLAQARVLALLDLADAIRARDGAAEQPRA